MTQIRRRVEGPRRREQILQLLREADAALDLTSVADRIGLHRNTARFHLESLVAAGQVEQVATPLGARGRPPLLYRSARGWDPAGPRRYGALATALLEHLRENADPVAAAQHAGVGWGRRLAVDELTLQDGEPTTQALVRGLERLDFAPGPASSVPSPASRGEPSSCGGVLYDNRPIAHRNPPHVDEPHRNPPHVDCTGGQVEAAYDEQQIDLRHCPFQELSGDEDRLVCHLHAGMLRGVLEAWRTPTQLVALEPMVEPGRCVVRLADAASDNQPVACCEPHH